MDLKVKINSIIKLAKNNKKIIENYFFMTILQVLNSFFYLLIYPYLIRTLGAESYGLFVFATSITTYFIFLVNFGFDFPATKAVAENVDNRNKIQETLSCVFTAKIYLLLLSVFIIGVLLFFVPFLKQHFVLFVFSFAQVISFIIFPQWFFQGIQNMKVITYIQLLIKIVSLPFIFYLIKKPSDVSLYVLIVSLSSLLGGIIAYGFIRFKYNYHLRFVKRTKLKIWFKDSLPFFLSTSAAVIKEQSITIIIGSFFGMKDVAVYDLANKIIIMPRTIFMSINGAIFPKLIREINNSKTKKIINIEVFLSLSVIIFIAIFGNFIVKILGGDEMIKAYPLSILLSVTVMSWLVVGAYISFVFIPNNRYYLVTKNQIVALSSFLLYTLAGLLLYKSIFVFGIAMALSGLTEIVYCKIVANKYRLLS
ncbi:oligosaccharide flippase family protein [Empedobacter falsenii]